MTKLRFDGRHLDDLADGRTVEPGQIVDLTAEEIRDPHNQRLIAEGLLTQLDTGKTTKKED